MRNATSTFIPGPAAIAATRFQAGWRQYASPPPPEPRDREVAELVQEDEQREPEDDDEPGHRLLPVLARMATSALWASQAVLRGTSGMSRIGVTALTLSAGRG